MVGPLRRARIDLDALAANLQATPVDELDARADAFGHSLDLVAPVAVALGVTAVRVSTDADIERCRALGFRDARVDRGGAPDARPYGLAAGGVPVMTLEGEVIASKRVAAEAGVSYGYTYRTSSATTLALVGLGYADGVPRLASNRGRALVGAGQHPVAGRIAMDQLVVDCGSDEPAVGSTAVLFGDPRRGTPSALDWATWTERDPAILTAGLGARVTRVAVGGAR